MMIFRRRREENERSEDRLIYGTPRPEEARVDCPHRFATIDKGKQSYSPMKATLRTQMGGEYTHIWELRRPPCVVDPQVENEGNAMQEECAGCAGCKAFHWNIRFILNLTPRRLIRFKKE